MADNNENRELAIKLTDVRKMYKLGQIGGGTLQADIQSWWAKKRGLEDPNTKIGEQRLIGQTFMALNGINLEVYKGEALGIIGGNGAGKSTMLKLLSRVTAPTSGKIQIWGRIASMLEVGTGFNGEMTGRENIYMNGAILGMTRAEIDAKMEDIIEFSEVRDFIDTPVKRYSSGMYVKLAFSVAAHLDSEIMIMDEVLAVGDVNFQQKCLKKMRDAAKMEGRTVLYVSHNMNTIRQLCDRCAVLNQGRMVYIGNVEEAIEKYSLNKEVGKKALYDFRGKERLPGVLGQMKMEKVSLSPKKYGEDSLSFVLSYTAESNVENCILRFVVFSNTGDVVGACYSTLFNTKCGKNEYEFSFNMGTLAPGTYLVDLILCSYNNMIQWRHDIVTRAFVFSRDEEVIRYNMEWNKAGWGNIQFSDLIVKEVNNNG